MYLIITSKDRNLVKMLMIPTQVVIFNLYRPQSLKYFNILFLEIFFILFIYKPGSLSFSIKQLEVENVRQLVFTTLSQHRKHCLGKQQTRLLCSGVDSF